MKDEVGNFWVVTKPTKYSELIDILFKADIWRMYLQFRGGLTKKEIVLITHNKSKANSLAKKLLKSK